MTKTLVMQFFLLLCGGVALDCNESSCPSHLSELTALLQNKRLARSTKIEGNSVKSTGALKEVDAQNNEQVSMLLEIDEECNWQCYLDRYAGLAKVCSTVKNPIGCAKRHWKTHGKKEGRNCKCDSGSGDGSGSGSEEESDEESDTISTQAPTLAPTTSPPPTTPAPADVCPEEVRVSGAETQKWLMGVYVKISLNPGENNADHPIYQMANKTYLYYWAPFKNWRISRNYSSGLGRIAGGEGQCPTQVSWWGEWNGKWVYYKVTVKTTAPTPAPTPAPPLAEVNVTYVARRNNHYCQLNEDERKQLLKTSAQASVQDCADAVNADGECGTVFYGKVGLCACMKQGNNCKEAESSKNNTIYEIVKATPACSNSISCANGGKASGGSSNCSCICPWGYIGTLCETFSPPTTTTPVPTDVCPEKVRVSGAEKQKWLMGVYVKTSLNPGENNADHPIYQMANKTYLYYWAPFKNWRISRNYSSGLGRIAGGEGQCPTQVSWWGEWNGKWVYYKVTVKAEFALASHAIKWHSVVN